MTNHKNNTNTSNEELLVPVLSVGVQCEGGSGVEQCNVLLSGDLRKHKEYTEKVQIFTFDDFTLQPHDDHNKNGDDNTNKNDSLSLVDFMNKAKNDIEYPDMDISDPAVENLHKQFLPIVQQIMSSENGVYASILRQQQNLYNREGFQIRPYAKPTYRYAS
eukprot:7985944-Ditylum_brightwellii.AAC.1